MDVNSAIDRGPSYLEVEDLVHCIEDHRRRAVDTDRLLRANSGHSPTAYKPARATSLARSLSNKQSRRFQSVFVLCRMMPGGCALRRTRKIAAILVSDVVRYSLLAGADEDRTLARLRALRSDLIDPTISV